MTYQAAVRALGKRGRFGIHLGLGRTRALLAALGNPERTFRGALIAGTNGKGSVLALASSALRAAGLRVGETPKPHLVSYRERLQVDGRPIDPDMFTRLIGEVLRAADRVPSRLGPPTEFELLTAAIFRWFAELDLDVAIVEVGLGGRLDATHAWDGGVAVVTNVALDHMDRLGSTIPAATGEALVVVRRRAAHLGVPLAEVAPAPLLGWDRDGIDVELPRLGPTRVGLRGRHQAANVTVADATLDALEAAGIASVPADARRRGYAAARWPGRLELLTVRGRDVLLDGAHNPAGAATLAQALDDLRPFLTGAAARSSSALTLVTGAMADKDVDGIVAALAGAAALADARIIATHVDLPRAMPAENLAERWRTLVPDVSVEAVADVGRALDRALETGTGPIVVAGSLYLVGEARRRWLPDPLLDDPEEPPP